MLTKRSLSEVAAAVALGPVLLVACVNLEDPAPPTESRIVVHGVLDTHSEVQQILITRARTGAESTNRTDARGYELVSGAVVTVMAPNGAVMIASEAPADSYDSYTAGVYKFNPGKFGVALVQGSTYSLHIRTTASEEVTGTTTIPLAPTALSKLPPRVFYRDRDTLRLSWPRVPGTASFELYLRAPHVGYRVFADTAVMIPGTTLTISGDEVFPSGARIDLGLSAVDANYHEYYRAQSDPFAGPAPSRLTGAVGVFGSVVPILLDVLRVR